MDYKKTVELMLNRFPDFQEAWKEHLDFWESDHRTIGIDITAFSEYIARKLERKEQYDFKGVFDFIEMLLADGDESVQTAATTMFLENLANLSSNGLFSSRDFVAYLGPKSIEYCKAWDDFCGTKTEGL